MTKEQVFKKGKADAAAGTWDPPREYADIYEAGWDLIRHRMKVQR
jgi:hypothetical protein